MGSSQLKAAKLLQYEEDDSEAKAAAAAAAKGGAEDEEEEEEESGESLEASNEQDGRVPGQHDEEEDEQGWMDGGISSCWYFLPAAV